MRYLKQSTTTTVQVGPFLAPDDGVTPKTGVSPTVYLSKAGAAQAARNSATAITHDRDGWYRVELDATDTGTLGPLILQVTDAATHLAVWHEFMVVPAIVYDSLVGGTDLLQVDTTQIEGADATDTINAQADQALADYDPPTKTELDAGFAALNDLSAAEVNAEVDQALADVNLDHLVGTATGIPAVPAGTFLDQIMDDGTASYDRTTDSLQAIRDRGDAAWTGGGGSGDWTTDEKEQIRDALGIDGTKTAATGGQLQTLAGYVDTEVAAIKAKTDALPTDPADQSAVEAAITAATSPLATAAALATVDTVVDAILADTGTDGVVLSAAQMNKIADHVRRRTQANVEASSDGDALALDSLYGLIQAVLESAISGGVLTVKKTDGSTTLGTKNVATDAGADPITGVS